MRNWVREPFNGGCDYIEEYTGTLVTGYYDSPKFEADCSCWVASNVPDMAFDTVDAAIDAANAANAAN